MTRDPLPIELVEKPRSKYQRMLQSVPLFISLLALSVSVYSSWETRLHNRISVRPIVFFKANANERNGDLGLSVSNTGLGPAILSNLTIFLDGQRVEGWGEILNGSDCIFTDNQKVDFFDFTIFLLKENATFNFLRTDTSGILDQKRFRDLILSRIVLRITACSLYEECATLCSTGECASKYLSN